VAAAGGQRMQTRHLSPPEKKKMKTEEKTKFYQILIIKLKVF
jgi:hypothetical protein